DWRRLPIQPVEALDEISSVDPVFTDQCPPIQRETFGDVLVGEPGVAGASPGLTPGIANQERALFIRSDLQIVIVTCGDNRMTSVVLALRGGIRDMRICGCIHELLIDGKAEHAR